MNQPPVFISCVSPEFRQTRSRVAAILTRLGYTPVIQEIFGTEPGDLRQVLRDRIDACGGLIQLVGHSYGAEPPTVEANYGRVSYTQFEFLYARAQQKKTWLLLAGDACSRDTPLERLDFPGDPTHPDPAGYQAERRALQRAYCDQLKRDGHLFHTATSDTDLELKVERLRDELAELRQVFKLWQNKVLRAFAVVFVLLVLIGSGVWWFGNRQHWDIQQISAEARHITREKIRAQLLESAEITHQNALAEAAKAKGWEERERLRKAADQANLGRLSRIDELANFFAEIEGTDRSTKVFDEMTRILAREGVDQALAYVSTQRASILEKVRARAAAAREKNRADLLPLLKSAQLEADRNQPVEAARQFGEVLVEEPDWPDALDAQFLFLITQGDYALGHGTLEGAFGYFQAAETTAQHLRKVDPDALRSHHDLSKSYDRIGEVQSAKGDLLSALSSYNRLQEIAKTLAAQDPANPIWQRDLSVSYARIGDVQSAQGQLASALSSYNKFLEITVKLAARDPANTDRQRDLTVCYDRVGNVQSAQGDLPSALDSYKKGLEIREKLADRDPANTDWERALSISYNKIGDMQRARGDLLSALDFYKKDLQIAEKLAAREPSSTDWQRDLSVSYERIADMQRARGDLLSALSSYNRLLEIREKLATRDPANTDWQHDLSVSYARIGDVQSAQGHLASALSSYNKSLEITEKLAARDPANVQWRTDLALSLWKLGSILNRQLSLREAGANYQRALEILLPLAVENRLTAEQKQWISQLEAGLKAVGREDTKMGESGSPH
jgi:tetratricopeptide (TPR) repeat protein